MKLNTSVILIIVLLFIPLINISQNISEAEKAYNYLDNIGEVYLKIDKADNINIYELTKLVSIDNVDKNFIYIYCNKKQFDKLSQFNYNIHILNHPNESFTNPKMWDGKSKADWDFTTYPTYQAYIDMMYEFEDLYPNLCEIVEIGESVEGRKILFAKISDNISTREKEPRFMHTSSMHGDEITGYVLTLRLIDYLLNNYGSDAKVDSLVNNLEIWINPLANPDGTYIGGNNTVENAVRYNANNVDLNRNFTNSFAGSHPDGEEYQPETVAMMNITDEYNFTMSANIHGGAELVNYPWDTWTSTENTHADDNWWQYVSHIYADNAIENSPDGYFHGFDNGISNGGDWFVAYGTRQDYINYYRNCREFTLEISNEKLLQENELDNHWTYNKQALLDYMEQGIYGIHGTITDSLTGDPLEGEVLIISHDNYNSQVNSELPLGDYYRPIFNGTYNITYSADGYKSKTYSNIDVENNSITIANAELIKLDSTSINNTVLSNRIKIFPNPSQGKFYLYFNDLKDKDALITFFDVTGNKIAVNEVYKTSNQIREYEISNLRSGCYFIYIKNNNENAIKRLIITN